MCVAGCSRPQADSSHYANDRAEIENLQARYLFALDFNDGKAYASVFAPVGAESVVHAYGHSEDEYRKIDGHWFWARRKIFNEMILSRLAPDANPAGFLGK